MLARDMRFVAPGRKRLRKLRAKGEVLHVRVCDDATSEADTDVGDHGEEGVLLDAGHAECTLVQAQPGAVLRADAKFGIQ
ncbi:hypothetical protein, partial [Klebsiella pneumoniae]|uniref:hypothetical protein n=1 Tax=Klebsiella pneumoniae TaxID=573 RepID=UPI0025A19D61